MDLIKLLFDSEKYKNSCFLCFKCNKNSLNIYSVFEITNEYCNISLSVAEMYKSLFTCQNFLFSDVCDDCLDLLCKIHTLMHKRNTKIIFLNSILKQLQRKAEDICIAPDAKRVFVNLQVPTPLQDNNDESVLNKDGEKCYLNTVYDPIHNQEAIVKGHPHCSVPFQQIDKFKSLSSTRKFRKKRIYHYCNDCNYKTLSKTSLQGHINKNHLNTRPHICRVCFKGFYNKSNLNEHFKIHDNQRSEICEICGYTFLHKKNLLEHLRLHSDTRPYQCSICSKKFVTSGRRSDHIKRSHMEKSECCAICNKKYSLKKELTRHMNHVHLITM